jgi:hypothetical protein
MDVGEVGEVVLQRLQEQRFESVEGHVGTDVLGDHDDALDVVVEEAVGRSLESDDRPLRFLLGPIRWVPEGEPFGGVRIQELDRVGRRRHGFFLGG